MGRDDKNSHGNGGFEIFFSFEEGIWTILYLISYLEKWRKLFNIQYLIYGGNLYFYYFIYISAKIL